MVELKNAALYEGGFDQMHNANSLVTWIYFLYHMGAISFKAAGKSDEYTDQILSLVKDNEVGFIYVRFEEYPPKYALITWNGHNAFEGNLADAKKEFKKLVKIVDFELETDDDMNLPLEEVRFYAKIRAANQKRLLLQYLEGLKQIEKRRPPVG